MGNGCWQFTTVFLRNFFKVGVNMLFNCHFGYFMEYGLRAKERKKAGFEAPEVGTFLHDLLENVNRDVRERGGYAQVDDETLRHMVKHYVDRYAATRIDGYQHKSARFKYLFGRLRETACTIILGMAEEMRQSILSQPGVLGLDALNTRLFGDRVYVYGSHDFYNGYVFCMGDYVCWSAPVDDLGNWRYEGVIYPRNTDPLNKEGKMCLYAPDVTVGPDGRYYLYYVLDKVSVVSVAVCDSPAGKYEFYGYVHYEDGTRLGERPGDEPQFDPGVLTEGNTT